MLAVFVKVLTMCICERSAVFSRIPNILRITVRFRTSPLSRDIDKLLYRTTARFTNSALFIVVKLVT